MPIWVAATLLAGLFQTWRTALQQKLRGQLSVNAAAVVRYLYGVPVGMMFVALYLTLIGGELSADGREFSCSTAPWAASGRSSAPIC